MNPAKLGKYFYIQYDAAEARLRYAADAEILALPFWRRLDEAGVRAGIVDVPHMPPSAMTVGFSVSYWGAHDNVHDTRSSPAELQAEIRDRCGAHPVDDCEKFDADLRSRRALRASILEGIGTHGRLFRWLMTTRPWDVFFGVFSASHCVGHHFWEDTPLNGDGTGQEESEFAGTVEEVYRAIDREVGALVDLVGEETRVMLVAAHGMGPLRHASWNLNQMLDLLGLSGLTSATTDPRAHRAPFNLWRTLRMALPSRWQYALKERLPKSWQDHLVCLWYSGRRDFAGRRAFAVPHNDIVGAIRISLEGRDRGGIVTPGVDYERLLTSIEEALTGLTDPATGRAVVADVIRPQKEFSGPFAARLPDLCVRWNADFEWHAVRSPAFGVLRLRRLDSRTGSHTSHGFLLAEGPGFPRGATFDGCSTLDNAPTVLQGAGLAVPSELDGRSLV
jgi:predicted AlkP superfamily phosphohydrolase/phosphomutase